MVKEKKTREINIYTMKGGSTKKTSGKTSNNGSQNEKRGVILNHMLALPNQIWKFIGESPSRYIACGSTHRT